MDKKQDVKQDMKNISFDVKFENFSDVDEEGFVRGKVKVAYAGKNRNYSDITKDAFEKAQSSIFNRPVVGNWLEEEENFGGHDMILEKRGNKFIVKDTTVPYGVVPESCNPRWEAVEDENGNVKNYFTVDVVLWHERYPEQIQAIMDGKMNQSMEIMIRDGEWDSNYDYFVVNDFYYSALCILGRERDESGKGNSDVEPCFEDSDVEVYQFEAGEAFNSKLAEMMNKFNMKTNNKIECEGGEVEKVDEIEKVAMEEEVVEEPVAEEVKVPEEKNMESTEEVEDVQEVEAEADEPVEEQPEEEQEEPGKEECEKSEDIEPEEKQEDDFEVLKQNMFSMSQELEELRRFKADVMAERVQVQKEQERQDKLDIFERFSKLLTDAEMASIKESMEEFSADEIDVKLAKAYTEKMLQKADESVSEAEVVEAMENFTHKEESKTAEKNRFAI